MRRVERYIVGGAQAFGPLLVELGDSTLANVGELHCFHDGCWSPSFEGTITWSVDDSSVVAARVVVPDSMSPDSSLIYVLQSPAHPAMLTGRKLGRTTLRARLSASASDTLPSWTPPSRSLIREVHVIPSVARLELSAPSRAIRAGDELELRVRALDRSGRRVPVPIDLLFVGEFGLTAELHGRVPHAFPNAGTATVIARFGEKADTLTLEILPTRQRAKPF